MKIKKWKKCFSLKIQVLLEQRENLLFLFKLGSYGKQTKINRGAFQTTYSHPEID